MSFRYYQQEANQAICNELIRDNQSSCLVKMFCGTGKSLLMRQCSINEGKRLIAFVFPSLPLLEQFHSDYLGKWNPAHLLIVSSLIEGTTDRDVIATFLQQQQQQEQQTRLCICVTYQSFGKLVDALTELNQQIDVCHFDEAHNAVGETYQELIFSSTLNHTIKQIFYTATPKNANGIIMYDKDHEETGMCGKLVYEYTYLDGIGDDYLNPIDLRIGLYMEDTRLSIYESIAVAVVQSKNNRVLTFHSDVNADRSNSVNQFVDLEEFRRVFTEQCRQHGNTLFDPDAVEMVAMHAGIIAKCKRCKTGYNCCRKNMLKRFDNTPANHVFIISSCETIGEGIDTRRANMTVFVDPKTSSTKIIQNIGRVVRKQRNDIKPPSTVLIPCWVDKTKYADCDGDREKCDAVIRDQLSKVGGDYNGILNVVSALRQEDPDIYDMCLTYPHQFSPNEIEHNLGRQGYQLEESRGSLRDNVEYLLGPVLEEKVDDEMDLDLEEEKDGLDDEMDLEEDLDQTDEEYLQSIAADQNRQIEVHTTSLEQPIEYFGERSASNEKPIRLFKEFDEEQEEYVYRPIVLKDKEDKDDKKKKNNNNVVHPPDRSKRIKMDVHASADVKVLWKITSDIDCTTSLSSCVIDCEVTDNWYERFDQLKQFVQQKRKRPNKKSTDGEEKQLGVWIGTQLQNYKKHTHSMQTEEKRKLWNLFIQDNIDLFRSLDELWDKTFEQLKTFTDVEQKKPLQAAKDEEEKHLGSWIVAQQQNYKKKIQSMKFEERRILWNEFIQTNIDLYRSQNEKWEQTFNQVKTFVATNQRKPNSNSKNKKEKQLGSWIIVQQQNYKKKIQSMKFEERREVWNRFIESNIDHFQTGDEQWLYNFEEVEQFIVAKQKIPNKRSNNVEEKQLAMWIIVQKKNYKEQTMLEERRVMWEKFIQDNIIFFRSIDDQWQHIFEQVKTFVVTNQRRPKKKNADLEEKRLGMWVSAQQVNYKKKIQSMASGERRKIWNNFIHANINLFQPVDEIWEQSFEQVKIFIAAYQRRPSDKSKNKKEKQLCAWIGSQIQNYKKCNRSMSSKERREMWDDFIQDNIDLFRSINEVWDRTFEQVKTFIATNQRRPTQHSKDQEEKQLGLWINNQQQSYKKCNMQIEGRRILWDNFIQDNIVLFRTLDEVWDQTFDRLNAFITSKQRMPKQRTKNQEENHLAHWIVNQIQNYKKCNRSMSLEERRNMWDHFMQDNIDLLRTFNEVWERTFEQVKTFIATSQKRPTSNSKEQEEQQLGAWICTQNQNYKKQINSMATEERRQLWSEFVATYLSIDEDIQSTQSSPIQPDNPKKRKSTTFQPPKARQKQKTTTNVPIYSTFSNLLKEYKTCRSDTLGQRFKTNPELWHSFHQLSEENERGFEKEEIPRNRVIAELDKLKVGNKRRKVVVDMGCGKGQIAQHFAADHRFHFYNYDHLSVDHSFISECDISRLPLEDHEAEICILSMAMWGTNCEDYVKEAHRVLETGGHLYVIEPSKRWTTTPMVEEEKEQDEQQQPIQCCDKLVHMLVNHGFRMVDKQEGKFTLLICYKA